MDGSQHNPERMRRRGGNSKTERKNYIIKKRGSVLNRVKKRTRANINSEGGKL